MAWDVQVQETMKRTTKADKAGQFKGDSREIDAILQLQSMKPGTKERINAADCPAFRPSTEERYNVGEKVGLSLKEAVAELFRPAWADYFDSQEEHDAAMAPKDETLTFEQRFDRGLANY